MPDKHAASDLYVTRSRYVSRFNRNGLYISFVASEDERESIRDIQKSRQINIAHTHAGDWTDCEFAKSILDRSSRLGIPILSNFPRPSQIPSYKEAQIRTSVIDGEKSCNVTGGTSIEKPDPDKPTRFAIFEDEEGQAENTPDNG